MIASHPRSGTHLALDLIRLAFPGTASWKFPGEANDAVYLSLDRLVPGTPRHIGEGRALTLLGRAETPLAKTHGLPGLDFLKVHAPSVRTLVLDRSRYVYVCRDPLKVMASLFRMVGPPDASEDSRLDYVRWLREPQATGTPCRMTALSRLDAWAQHVLAWFDFASTSGARCLLINFDTLCTDPWALVHQLEGLGYRPGPYDGSLPAPFRSRAGVRRSRLLRIHPPATTMPGTARLGSRPDPTWVPDDLLTSRVREARSRIRRVEDVV